MTSKTEVVSKLLTMELHSLELYLDKLLTMTDEPEVDLRWVSLEIDKVEDEMNRIEKALLENIQGGLSLFT